MNELITKLFSPKSSKFNQFIYIHMPSERIELSAFGYLKICTRPTLYHWAMKASFIINSPKLTIRPNKILNPNLYNHDSSQHILFK